MNQEKEFCILHQLSDTQFLVNTTFDHDVNEFQLSYKFWAEPINGYIEATLHWPEDREPDYERTFDKFKDIEYCEKFKEGLSLSFETKSDTSRQ